MTTIDDSLDTEQPEPAKSPEGSRFRYVAETFDGETVSGELIAASLNAARNELAVQGLKVVKLTERKGLRMEITKEKVSQVEIMHFCRQMATFLRAGVPITEALDELRLDAKSKRFRQIISDALDRVSAGRSVADALADHDDIFPPYFMAILRSSELTGRMDDAFAELHTYIHRDLELRRQVRKALIYPCILLAMAIGVCLLMVVFAIPRFAEFFEGFGAELPLPTRMLMSVSDFVQSTAGIVTGLVLVVAAAVAFVYFRSDRGRPTFHALQLRIPVVNTVITHSASERFTRVLAALLDAGVALPDALPTAVQCSENSVFKGRLAESIDGILAGQGFAEPLARTELFPRTVVQMVRVGERTGELSLQLQRAAGFYEEELTYAVDKLTAWFEPLVILFIGVVVGFVALAMVSAMYGIYNQVEM